MTIKVLRMLFSENLEFHSRFLLVKLSFFFQVLRALFIKYSFRFVDGRYFVYSSFSVILSVSFLENYTLNSCRCEIPIYLEY